MSAPTCAAITQSSFNNLACGHLGAQCAICASMQLFFFLFFFFFISLSLQSLQESSRTQGHIVWILMLVRMELFIDYDAFEHGRCRVPAIAVKFTLHNCATVIV